MSMSTNVVQLRQPDEIDDPLTDVLRAGARRLLAQAVELEAEAFLAGMRVVLATGHAELDDHAVTSVGRLMKPFTRQALLEAISLAMCENDHPGTVLQFRSRKG